MTNVMTTKMSSKGQVVLPEALRNSFGWNVGTAFTVVAYKGAVVLQPIVAPTENELARKFDSLFDASKTQAKLAGMTKDDISRTIAEVRQSRRSRRKRA